MPPLKPLTATAHHSLDTIWYHLILHRYGTVSAWFRLLKVDSSSYWIYLRNHLWWSSTISDQRCSNWARHCEINLVHQWSSAVSTLPQCHQLFMNITLEQKLVQSSSLEFISSRSKNLNSLWCSKHFILGLHSMRTVWEWMSQKCRW